MTEKLKSLVELADTQPEILAWICLVCAIVFELREFNDTATVAMFFLSMFLMGYVRKAKAGVFEIQGDPDGKP